MDKTLDRKLLGQRLTQARKALGLSAAEVADAMGISASYMSNWETGKRNIKTNDLVQLSGILHVPVPVLLDGMLPEDANDVSSKNAKPAIRDKEFSTLMENTTLTSLLESLHELASTVKMHKELESERIAAERERARLVDAVKAQAEADRASAERELAHANVLAQENIREALQLVESPHSTGPEGASEAAEDATAYGS